MSDASFLGSDPKNLRTDA